MWVWVLTLTLVLFMVVVFHEMEANGWLEPGAVESLEIVFHIMIGMVFFGTALLILGTALSLGAYYQRTRSS